MDKKIIYFILIGFVVLFFIVPFILLLRPRLKPAEKSNQNIVMINGILFKKINGLWNFMLPTSKKLINTTLRFLPNETQADLINTTKDDIRNWILLNNNIYVAFDPNQNNLQYVALAASELGMNLGNSFNINGSSACIKNESVCHHILNCKTEKGIVILNSNKTRIFKRDNCFYIEGNKLNILKSTEKFLYIAYGII